MNISVYIKIVFIKWVYVVISSWYLINYSVYICVRWCIECVGGVFYDRGVVIDVIDCDD